MLKKMSMAIIFATIGMNAYADHNPNHKPSVEDNVKAVWNKTPPTMNLGAVKATSIPGVFKVNTEVFIDPTGRFMMVGGKIFDTLAVNSVNAGAPQPSQAERPAPPKNVDVKLLNTQNAIKSVKGNGERTLYVFSDPDCPFCKRLEQTLEGLDNVTVYTFPYPLEGLHPKAKATSISIWCNENPSKAWKDYMLNNTMPKDATCTNPIEKNIELANKLEIRGTPAIIGPTGIVLPGAYPLEAIEDMLKKSKK